MSNSQLVPAGGMHMPLQVYEGQENYIWTVPGICSFPHLDIPSKPETSQGRLKYNLNIIFPDNSFLDPLWEKLNDAAFKKFGGNPPAGLNSPLHQKLEKRDKAGYEGEGYFLSAGNEVMPPYIFEGQTITNPADITRIFYSGCWVQALVNFWGYNKGGGRGVGAQLMMLQWLCHGEQISGGPQLSGAGIAANVRRFDPSQLGSLALLGAKVGQAAPSLTGGFAPPGAAPGAPSGPSRAAFGPGAPPAANPGAFGPRAPMMPQGTQTIIPPAGRPAAKPEAFDPFAPAPAAFDPFAPASGNIFGS